MRKKPLPANAMDDVGENFDGLYEANQPLIYRFMFWRTKDEMLAQDLTSHVFEKAWRTRTSFTSGSDKAWLFKIARTTLIDYWRKKKDLSDDGTLAAELESDAPSLEETASLHLELERLHTALLKLPVEMHEVVKLRFMEGLSARETGERLHMSEANVRVVQYRALKKLRGYLQ
jgi:RNA polymerase sigma-70 factor (ECF subfamily)